MIRKSLVILKLFQDNRQQQFVVLKQGQHDEEW